MNLQEMSLVLVSSEWRMEAVTTIVEKVHTAPVTTDHGPYLPRPLGPSYGEVKPLLPEVAKSEVLPAAALHSSPSWDHDVQKVVFALLDQCVAGAGIVHWGLMCLQN